MSVMNPISSNIFNAEFLNTPAAALAAWISIIGAVMTITSSFGVADVTMALCGYPSTDYAARTIVTHLFDYGYSRFEMGYACAIATILFLMMILCNKAIQSLLRRVGT